MRYQYKFLKSITVLAAIIAVSYFSSCKVEPLIDPNNPSPDVISQNASLGEIQNLVTGTESTMRNDMSFYWDDAGVIGREFYRFSTSDPRFTSDLLGKGSAVLDNNTFYIINPFAARYRVVKNTNILIDALTNTKATITDAQRKAGIAYANTIQAHELLMVFNLEYDNGIRVDVKDPDNPGPFLSKDLSLTAILDLLNLANTDLQNNNVDFPFNSNLYSNNAMTFSKFNRVLAARVSVYKSDWTGTLSALNNSFFNLIGDLNEGAYYRGDSRLNKVSLRASAGFQDGLQSNYDFYVYKTNTDRIPIIRNEELVLIYAEAKAQLGGANLADAVIALNKIRNAAGLPNYVGAVTQPSLIDEMLKQRRYSLYGEGHRWIDMRRYSRLAQLPADRAGDDVWVEFPRPATE